MSPHPSIRTRSAIRGVLVAGLALLAIDRPVPAQQAPEWRRDFHAALAEAERSNRPLLVCIQAELDGERANGAVAEDLYHDRKLRAALGDVVTVVASADGHAGDATQPCSRFGHVSCVQHQQVERQVRHHLFGERRDLVAPQHVLLLPDGSVCWHALYCVPASTLRRAVEAAKSLCRRNERARTAAFLTGFRKLITRADRDEERYLVLSTAFAHAPDGALGPMLRRIPDVELAERLLADAARVAPARMRERFATLGRDCPRRLEPMVAALRERLDTDAGTGSASHGDAANGNGPRRSGVAAWTMPSLTDLGPAQEIPGVVSTDELPGLLGSKEQATLLLFFLPDDPYLDRQLGVWNALAARVVGRPIRMVGLGASLHPKRDLGKTDGAGFAFPVGNYLYDRTTAPYSITSFPAAVLIDSEGRVRFQGDAYQAFARAVDSLLRGSGPAARAR